MSGMPRYIPLQTIPGNLIKKQKTLHWGSSGLPQEGKTMKKTHLTQVFNLPRLGPGVKEGFHLPKTSGIYSY